jgi:hypothetical protein
LQIFAQIFQVSSRPKKESAGIFAKKVGYSGKKIKK